MKSWPIITIDQNNPKIYDFVTKQHAEDLKAGQEIIAVCIEETTRWTDSGPIPMLDFGYAFFVKITEIKPVIKNGEEYVLVRAERIEDDLKVL